MAGSLVFAILLGAAVAIFNPSALWVALPLLIAWLIAPQIAYVISQPVTHITAPLSETQRRQVRRLARRTWAFFEQFAGPDDHWLPPDHFQESPRGNVAHYTTPTNIGLFLVSTLSAYDLGYMGLLELAVRLRSTFESMDKLEHYRGHLLNWYDSQTLTALPPRYISTVDSGNLAACLITLRQGCLALTDAPLLGDKSAGRVCLSFWIFWQKHCKRWKKTTRKPRLESFEVELTSIYERVSAIQNQPSAWTDNSRLALRRRLGKSLASLDGTARESSQSQSESLTELQLYLDLMHHHLARYAAQSGFVRALASAGTRFTCKRPPGRIFATACPLNCPRWEKRAAVYERIQTALNHFKTAAAG